jgi:tRNA threonylcarbamoyladenosine biosynthesis protein TsaE
MGTSKGLMIEHLEFQSESERQTRDIAAALARELRSGSVVTLEGELGAGKTMFVRGLAEGLGLDPTQVSSPTFVICHEYERLKAARRDIESPSDSKIQIATVHTLVHVDAYRIRSAEDLETIGWDDLLDAPGTIVAIEWPSRIAEEINRIAEDRRIIVNISHAGEHSRGLAITGPIDVMMGLRSMAGLMSFKRELQSPSTLVRCRTCGKEVPRDGPEFPFCSARCRLAELNKWFSESYRISRPAEEDEELGD